MGFLLSTVLSNFLMEYFDIALKFEPKKPKCFFRYIDDIFVIWPHGIESFISYYILLVYTEISNLLWNWRKMTICHF